MRTVKKVIMLILIIVLIFGAASCTVFVTPNNGNHKGWSKNSNNPHHPKNTKPGESKNWYNH